jgi:hypothetical protein
MYDVIWDPSILDTSGNIQQLQYCIEGRYLSYNMLCLDENFASKKSNLVKENTTSIASRSTSCRILVSSINGCVYAIDKPAKVKLKSKSMNAEIIFKIQKKFMNREDGHSVSEL